MVTMLIMILLGENRQTRFSDVLLTVSRYFVGGTVLNRPGVAEIGNTIVCVWFLFFGQHADPFS